MNDIFSNLGSIFGDIFGGGGFTGFSGGFGGSQRRVLRGSNLRIKVKLTLEEIDRGCEKKIKVSKFVPCKTCGGSGARDGKTDTCPHCHGSGVVTETKRTILGMMQTQSACSHCGGEGKVVKDKCHDCHGDGIVKSDEIITINIPAGVSEGMQLTVSGKGNAARHGGVNGVLLVLIEEEPDKELIREDNDLIYNLLLSFPTAALGGTVEIPTIDGKVKVKIDPGTQPGKVLRLRGKGLPTVNRYGNGDLLVNISVYIPENLSRDEKKQIEAMGQSVNFKTSPSLSQKIFSHFRNLFD